MSDESSLPPSRWIDSLDRSELERRLREVGRDRFPDRQMDRLEVRHLIRVITECSLILTDVYSDERVGRIMHPKRGFLSDLADSVLGAGRDADSETLHRVGRMPDDVRVVGDKALFDLSLLGRRRVRGYDLADLGARAYRMAAEALGLLAEDRRLRDFFKQNRLLMLPLEEEVVFLQQCSENFGVYAEILRHTHGQPDAEPDAIRSLAFRVPLMAAAAEALLDAGESLVHDDAEEGVEDETGDLESERYIEAARGDSADELHMSKERLISSYERILLFSSLKMSRLRDALLATVIDQQQATEALCDEFSLFGAGTRDQRKPPGYFLVGPTGVGKNHLVESLCRLLEGIWKIEIPVLTIEGPSYTYPSDINELRGATRGFIRSDEQGILTGFHEKSSRAPLAVLLVDEVEKAHPHLLTFFLSMLDRGTVTDNRGAELNFANCMVFFTSNLGYSDKQQESSPIGYGDDQTRQESADHDVRRRIRGSLKPEFVNRVRIIHFNRLSRASAERILELEFHRIAERYRSFHGLRIELDDSARGELIQRGFSPSFGARRLASTLDAICNVEIAKKLRKDDRGRDVSRGKIIEWLRKMRSGERPFDAEEAKRRVEETARAKLDYDSIRIVFDGESFEYVTSRNSSS